MPNKHQIAIAEINRARKTTRTMLKRLNKHDVVLGKAAKLLREDGVRPYRRRKQEKEVTMSQ